MSNKITPTFLSVLKCQVGRSLLDEKSKKQDIMRHIRKPYIERKRKNNMRNGKEATRDEKNYTLRRICYDILLATKSITTLKDKDFDFTEKEIVKFTAIMMARNFNEFLFGTNYKYDDDIHVSDFKLVNWISNSEANLKDNLRKRISKIEGHVVAKKPRPFKDNDEIRKFVVPLIRELVEFVQQCIKSGQAKYIGRANKYVDKANKLLPILGIPLLPKA